jgi:hypothetical protein
MAWMMMDAMHVSCLNREIKVFNASIHICLRANWKTASHALRISNVQCCEESIKKANKFEGANERTELADAQNNENVLKRFGANIRSMKLAFLGEDAERLRCSFCARADKKKIMKWSMENQKNFKFLSSHTDRKLDYPKTFLWFIISSCDPLVRSVKGKFLECANNGRIQCRLNWIKPHRNGEVLSGGKKKFFTQTFWFDLKVKRRCPFVIKRPPLWTWCVSWSKKRKGEKERKVTDNWFDSMINGPDMSRICIRKDWSKENSWAQYGYG